MNPLKLLTVAMLAYGVMPLQAADAIASKDPVAVVQARRELEQLGTSTGRYLARSSMSGQERKKWEVIAPHIGLSRTELDKFLMARADVQLQWRVKYLECMVEPACNSPGPPFAPRESDAELLALLGKDKHGRYVNYTDAALERGYVLAMQRALPPEDPLSDEQAEILVQAFAEERYNLVTQAMRRGLTARGPVYPPDTLPVYGAARDGAPDEIATRKESGAAFARRLLDRASALLTPSQLAGVKETLDRNLVTYNERAREWEIRLAARVRDPVSSGTVQTRRPGDVAIAQYRLEQLREPASYSVEAGKLAAQIRKDWIQRVAIAGVTAGTFDQLVTTLSVLQLEQQERLLECEADAGCDRNALKSSFKADLDSQPARVLGADAIATIRAFEEAYRERAFVAELRAALSSGHTLTEFQAGKLVIALAAERLRVVQSAERQGLKVDSSSPFGVPSAGANDSDEQRHASATAHARRLHGIAGTLLDAEQLRQMDAIHKRSLTTMKSALKEAAWQQSVRDAAARQKQ